MGIIGLSAALAGVAPVQAAVTPRCSPADRVDSAQRNEEINLATARMRHAGSDQAAIDAYLKRTHNWVKVSKEIAPAGGVGTLSDQGAINLPAPTIYRDTCGGRYQAVATWSWKSLTHIRNETYCGFDYTCDIGGHDGFGLSFSRGVADPGGYSLTTWGATSWYPASTSRAYEDDSGTDGVSYKGQDKFKAAGACCSKDYSFYNGQLVYSIDVPGCGHLTAFSKYGHSWSSTGVDSVSVGINSVTFSFSSSSNKWDRASNPSNTVIPC